MAESPIVEAQDLNKPNTSRGNAWCDDCDSQISATRYKCLDCHDFDYCSECFRHASLIHPGHHFEEISAKQDGLSQTTSILSHLSLVEDSKKSDNPSSVNAVGVAKLCGGCAPIVKVISAVASGEVGLTDEDWESPLIAFETRIRLSKTVAALQRRCAFCSLLADKLIGTTPVGHGHSHVWTLSYEPKASWYTGTEEDGTDGDRPQIVEKCMELLSRIKRDWLRIGVYIKLQGPRLPDFSNIDIRIHEDPSYDEIWRTSIITDTLELEMFAGKDDPAAKFVDNRPFNASPGTEDSLLQVKNWLLSCSQDHGETCRPTGEESAGRLPNLVIDVSSREELRLYRSSGEESDRYTALSYVWGTSGQSFQTTVATLSNKLAGFSIEKLPRTLQDAVKLTQALNIKYLWIDSLCIIQDLEDHRTHELSRMGQIYKHACLTICAGRCEDADKPFLDDRANPETGVHKDLVPFTFLLHGTKSKWSPAVLDPQRCQRGTLWVKVRDSPFPIGNRTSRRAWCLQESILSPRVVFYDRLAPVWRCNHLIESDGGTNVDSRIFTQEQILLNRAMLQGKQPQTKEDAPEISAKQIHYSWQQILEDYTKREMTLESDKLPGIGGIASEIGTLTGDIYLAGLWGQHIMSDLMWLTKSKEWLSRPEKWRAPSWSWASVDCPVLYGAVTDDSKMIAEIISCDVHLQSGNSVGKVTATKTGEAENSLVGGATSPTTGEVAAPITGEVSPGTLCIAGPLKKINNEHAKSFINGLFMAPAPPQINHVNEWNRMIYEHISQTMSSSSRKSRKDRDSSDEFPDTVYLFLLFERDWILDHEGNRISDIHCYSGLLLTEAKDGTFQRIGAFANKFAPDLDPEYDQVHLNYREVTIV